MDNPGHVLPGLGVLVGDPHVSVVDKVSVKSPTFVYLGDLHDNHIVLTLSLVEVKVVPALVLDDPVTGGDVLHSGD